MRHLRFIPGASRLVRALGPLCIAALLGACGGGGNDAPSGSDGGSTPAASTPSTAAPYTLAVSAQPLAVGLTTDDARAVTQTVKTTGGTVVASGVDGTVYTLTVPADALLADTDITMTPVARFTSLPFKGGDTGAAYGVQLAPEGLQFNVPLTLHIEPPSGTSLPIGQQLPFNWTGTGQAVALAALDPSSAGIDLKLMHFSGWAIARHSLGVSASLSGLRDQLGGTVEARMESALAERLAAERDGAHGATDAGLISDADLAAYVAEFDAKVVRPRVAAAGQSCAGGRLAMQTMFMLARQLDLLGVSNTYQAQALALLVPTATMCVDEEYTKCRDNHIVQDIAPAVLGMDRQAQLLGIGSGADWQAWRDHAEQQVDLCHRYRLEFDSTAGDAKPLAAGWDFSEHMFAAVKLRLSGLIFHDSSARLVGSDALRSVGYAISYHNSCEVVSGVSQADSVLSVQELDIFPAKDGSISDFKLIYFPGQNGSTHRKTDNCASPPSTTTEQLFTWSSVYYVDVLGNPLYFSATDGPFVDHWTVNQGSATLATKDIAPTLFSGEQTFTAPTHFKLIHTPGA